MESSEFVEAVKGALCVTSGILPVAIAIKAIKRWARKHGQTPEDTHKPLMSLLRQSPTGSTKGDSPDVPIYWWDKRNVFTRRNLLRSVAIFGASGSGKSSGSGANLMSAIFKDRMSSGLLVASKPEEREEVIRALKKAGRLKDLIIFGPDEPARFNPLSWLVRSGGDSRDLTQSLMVFSESLKRKGGGGGRTEPFFEAQKELGVYNGIEMLRQAGEETSASNLQRFIDQAATSPRLLLAPDSFPAEDAQGRQAAINWQANSHNLTFRKAHAAQKNATERERHDYEVILKPYWLGEVPSWDNKLRGSIFADIKGLLHTLNSGVVRELLGTSTNVSPDLLDEGAWILIDMPGARYGAAGFLVGSAWRYAVQRHVLRRHATDKTPYTVIWCDEAQNLVNSFDAAFLAECRSHRGCMVYLTQSIHAYYTVMQQGNEHEADSFLTNFGHKIFHAVGDDKTAAYASSLIGKKLQGFPSTTIQGGEDVYDVLMGNTKSSSTYSERYEDELQRRSLMHGLRAGGKENGYMTDAYVIRNEPFSNGKCYLKAAFSQR